MKQASFKKILLTFFITNLLIIFIPLAIFNIIHHLLTKRIVQDIEQGNELLVRQSQQMTEFKYSSAYRIAIRLSSQKDILFCSVKESFSSIESYNLLSITSLLSNAVNIENGIRAIYVEFPKSNMVVSSEGLFRYDDFYGTFFQYGDVSKSEWNQKMQETYVTGEFLPLQKVMIQDYRFSGTAYIKTISGDAGNRSNIIIIYDNDAVMVPTSLAYMTYSSLWHHAQDDESYAVFESGLLPDGINYSEIPLSGTYLYQDYVAICDYASNQNLRHISIFQYHDAFARSSHIQAISYFFCISAALIGLFISISAATSKARKVARIVNVLELALPSLNSQKRNIYNKIETGVHAMNLKLDTQKNNLDELYVQIDMQKHALQSFYLQKLFLGKFSSNEQAEHEALAVDFVWPKHPLGVVLLKIMPLVQVDMEQETHLCQQIYIQIVYHSQDFHFVFQEDSRSFIILTEYGEILRNYMQILLSEIQDVLNDYSDFFVAIGVSQPFEQLLSISRAYDEAHTIVPGKAKVRGATLIFYGDLPAKYFTYYYPFKVQQELIRYVKTGDSGKVYDILDAIFKENTINRYLSKMMIKQLIAELCGIALRLSEDIPSNSELYKETFYQEYERMVGTKDLADAEEIAHDMFCVIAASYKSQMKSHNTELVDNIYEYVNEQYTNSALSLFEIASKLNINENYLSTFFKEQTGQNLFSYIESLRINRSAELLKGNHLTIEELAHMVGYSNQHSFRRAFKKIMHQTPSDYKKTIE